MQLNKISQLIYNEKKIYCFDNSITVANGRLVIWDIFSTESP